MSKVLTPRLLEGREFEYWVRSVSKHIGVDPPMSLEEVGQQSISPVISQLRQAESRIESLSKQIAAQKNIIHELERKVNDLERSI